MGAFGHRGAWLAACLVLALLAASCGGGSSGTTLSLPTPAPDAVKPWVTTADGRFVDARGRPVVLGGVNVGVGSPQAYERAPELGIDFARVYVSWSQVEPRSPSDGEHHFDQHLLAALDREIAFFQEHRINVLLDFHQFRWSPYFGNPACVGAGCSQGNGVPTWYYADGRFPKRGGTAAAKAAFWTSESDRSLPAYAAFAEMMARRYARYPNVIGYEIMNEPAPGALRGNDATQAILRWTAQIRRVLAAVDPARTVVFMCRGGGNGVGTADLSPFGSLDHLALDFHDYFNGRAGTGLSQDGDEWVPSWKATHNQQSEDYTGSEAAQAAVLDVPLARTRRWRIPLIVGEWGVRTGTPGSLEYGAQMLALFREHGISWARWTLGGTGDFALLAPGGGWTPEALQLRDALTG
jgi:endoglycosylceramidase